MSNIDEILLAEVNKRLDGIATLLNGSGGLPPNAATETTLSALETKAATETTQVAGNSLLTDIKNSLLALKDGEFKLLSDPNDNDRLVALSVDMTIPSAPVYVYHYLDDNSPYVGSVNELENVTSPTQAVLNATLLQILELTDARTPIYYWELDAKVPGSIEVLNNVTFDYHDPSLIGIQQFDDGGDLVANSPFPSVTDMLNQLNSLQSIFEFYVPDTYEQNRIHSNTTVIAVRSNNFQIPEQFAGSIYLETVEGGLISDSNLKVLYPNDSAVDYATLKLRDIEQLITDTNEKLNVLTNTFLPKRTFTVIPLNSPTSGSWVGYPAAGTLLQRIKFIFEDSTDNEEVKFTTAKQPKIKFYYDLVNTINEHMSSLIAIQLQGDSLSTTLRLIDGEKVISNLKEVQLDFNGAALTYVRLGNTFNISFNNYDNTLDYIHDALDRIANTKNNNEEFLLKVSKGNVAGHRLVNVFGRNSDHDTGDPNANIWCVKGQTIVYPIADVALEVLSNNANDTAAGTGLRTVELEILKLDGTIIKEIVTLNGLTAVSVVATGYRVLSMLGLTAGSNGSNLGNVQVRTVVGANIQNCIGIGFNRATSSNYTVPAGKTGFIVNRRVRMNRYDNDLNGLNVAIKIKPFNGILHNIDYITIGKKGNNQFIGDRQFSKPLESLTDIQAVISNASDNNNDVVFDYQILLVDNALLNKYIK